MLYIAIFIIKYRYACIILINNSTLYKFIKVFEFDVRVRKVRGFCSSSSSSSKLKNNFVRVRKKFLFDPIWTLKKRTNLRNKDRSEPWLAGEDKIVWVHAYAYAQCMPLNDMCLQCVTIIALSCHICQHLLQIPFISQHKCQKPNTIIIQNFLLFRQTDFEIFIVFKMQ